MRARALPLSRRVRGRMCRVQAVSAKLNVIFCYRRSAPSSPNIARMLPISRRFPEVLGWHVPCLRAGATQLRRTFMIRSSIVACSFAALLIALGAGCNKAADEQEKANQAQAKANEKIVEANQEANKKANEAQAEADKKIAEAQATFLKLREDYRHDTTQKLVDLDHKIADLEAKAKTSVGKKKTELDTQLAQIRSQREAFANDWKTIETASATTWDSTKNRLDKEWNDLKALVDRAA